MKITLAMTEILISVVDLKITLGIFTLFSSIWHDIAGPCRRSGGAEPAVNDGGRRSR